ncbi:phosphoribosyltransferase [Acetobacter fabarum]|uniref:phosphoribosyltransferase n=1 Tax=Acetobacter fabarum TaxID=483199 RepID=UPI0039EAB4D8
METAKKAEEVEEEVPLEARPLLRVDWPPTFPQCFFHVPWRGSTDVPCCLAAHDLYPIAKNEMLVDLRESVRAARQIIDELHDERVFEQIGAYIRSGRETKVLAPVKLPEVNSNALGVVYAQAVASVFGFEVEGNIFQVTAEKRDRKLDSLYRLALPPIFRGAIKPGVDYILVDDVFTTGGTLAGLRGYIHRQGGNVVVCSTIAAGQRVTQQATRYDQRQMGVALAPTSDRIRALRNTLGEEYRAVDSVFCEGLRYGLQQLTEQEARFVSSQARTIRGYRGSISEWFAGKILDARSSGT